VHLPASAICSLADAVGNGARLADANANTSLLIAYDHDRTEGEATTTLDHFCDALDVDHTLVKFFALLTVTTPRTILAVASAAIITIVTVAGRLAFIARTPVCATVTLLSIRHRKSPLKV
jgi:hypothetical protein